ncbi:MAG: CBS domain-containing protein [Thermodesulfobacteriota bacterium]
MEVITTHQHADFDGLASMLAAKRLYPEAVLCFSGSQEKNIRDFFVQSSGYLYEFQRIRNIPLDKVRRLILVDTRTPSRIGPFAQCLANPGIEVHIYDHHPKAEGDLDGDLEVFRPVGSTATIFTQLFRERGIAISREEATVLGMAVYEDTGSFLFDTTTPDDLAAMAWLLECGANLQSIGQFLTHELSAQDISLLHEIIRASRTYTIQGVAVVVAVVSFEKYIDEFSLLARRFMVMENLDSLFLLARMANRIYLIARSRIPEVNAAKIAMEFGGGGHASAASSAVKEMTLIEAEEKLLQALHRHIRPRAIARELMSAPVIYVEPTLSIAETNTTLTRYNLTVLPVLADGGRLLGTISRRVTEKAIHHGLGHLPVTDYMTSDVATLPPSATLADIQELIVEHRQRFIPVVEDGSVCGVITRTDLLNLLINDPAHLPRDLLTREEVPSTERHRNLSNLIAETLPAPTVILLRQIGEIAAGMGYKAYVVGGVVRDLLLHVPNLDIDVVVEGDGIALAERLAAHLGGKCRPHEKFRTAVVILKDEVKIDIATARLEYYEAPAAMPTVELSSLKLDLFRRDFTINAMAINLDPARFGTLIDFFNCQNDLKDRQIRILHNLSFVEDPTRILRAVRLEQRMNFQIGKHTGKLIRNAVRMKMFDKFFGHRFFIELKLLLSEEQALPAVERLLDFGVLQFFLPEQKFDARINRLLEECQRSLAWHRLLYLDEPCRGWIVYLLALTQGLLGRQVLAFLRKFEVPERYYHLLLKERGAIHKTARLLDRRRHVKNSEIYWLLQDFSHEGLLYLMALTRNQVGKKAVSLFVTHLRHVRPVLTGAELIAMGYRPGPLFKTIFTDLREARLDGLVHTRGDEEAYLKRFHPLGEKNPDGNNPS